MPKETTWNYKKIIITTWIVISIIYISFDVFNKFVFWMYNNWYRNAINSVIEQSLNKDCKSFTVYNDRDKAELVNINCLQQSSTTNTK